MSKLSSSCLIVLLCLPHAVAAYDENDHESMTKSALAESDMHRDVMKRKRLGLRYSIDSERQKFVDSEGNLMVIADLVATGSRYEDAGIKSLHHFFNPVTSSSLKVPPQAPRYMQDWLPNAVLAVNAFTVKSPDWALDHSANVYSYRGFKNFYFAGLTSNRVQDRAIYLGLAYESLGRLVHHVQDMAQPQHVRNDMHWYDKDLDKCDRAALGAILCDAYWTLRARSTYEQWTSEFKLDFQQYSTYLPIYSNVNQTRDLRELRQAWSGAGLGLADYTNRNFLSAGTMAVAPPYLNGEHDELASSLCANAIPACGVQDLDHVVTFWHNDVTDELRPTLSGVNRYAASASIYEWDFRSKAPSANRPYVVNRFTFARNHDFLIPRAIGYSAGVINYVFRGEMQFEPSAEGVYGVIDMGGCGSGCTISVVKLRLKNATSNEPIGAGQLRLIAKYFVNACFRSDLAGEDGGPAFSSAECRSKDEAVSVSEPLAVASIGSEYGDPLIFFFRGISGIPINATDLNLQLVFRGKLGEEDDAIVVSTIDVAEPNFVAVGNLSDHYFSEGQNKYIKYPSGRATTPVTSATFSLRSPSSGPPLATVSNLNSGEHAQFAFITTKAATKLFLRINTPVSPVYFDNVPFTPDEFGKDDDDPQGTYARSCPVRLERGQYRQFSGYYIERYSGGIIGASSGAETDAMHSSGDVVAKYRANCPPSTQPGAGGLSDFSSMTPIFDASNQKAWTINFP